MSHLKASDTETAQSNDVWNESEEIYVQLFIESQLFVYFSQKMCLEASDTDTAQCLK